MVVFQPHLYSRTAELFDDFVGALSIADRPIVTRVYDARNTGKAGVTGVELVESVKIKNNRAAYIESFDDTVADLKSNVTADDVVLIMGAGDVTKIAADLTNL
ncbi:hypothetical protein A2392_03265 [Candidatus Kaiserbacteria bacterium RIFOXYB1_FULL_46_14]|uniref:Mur ligase C-terminal domain-containing protein n=1 Tax=Candidatus Kaiserbacteria bacterium RIFOXYB1_FULL_46_14 TaxID=1798531 RepID=A0A1F6FHZ7_9BACT|nr:MAG: hypothetical protein A2392_03265 [Candidatus Kaiserbacteria bacterium RIFOXYB1_FULL_46_14]